MAPDKRAKIAAEYVRAALYAEHILTERIEGGQAEYRRVVLGSSGDESASIV
jgi:hypothetical protein